jgi:hypothetical protein
MKKKIRLLAAVALGLPGVTLAGPSDYVYGPAVEYGEREIDFKIGTAKLRNDEGRESAASLGFGYGLTQWWFTEAYLKYHHEPGAKSQYDAFEWENKFQLTEHNQYFVDVGLITEFEAPRHEEGYEFKIGPLFQGDAGPVRWNANLLFERVFRGSPDEAHPTEMGYQLQARYSVRQGLDVGAQAFGDMGKWDHWAPSHEQDHRLGPAVFGKIKMGEGREAIRYNAAWLFGVTDGVAKNTFRLQAEYEF